MSGHIADAGNVSWNTPLSVLEAVKEVFGGVIDLDPCSNDTSIVGALTSFSLPEVNALQADWAGHKNIYVNPPFGFNYISRSAPYICIPAKEYRQTLKDLPEHQRANYANLWKKQSLSLWVGTMDRVAKTSSNIIALIPASVDTSHWQDTIFSKAQAVCFIDGRIKFLINGLESTNSAPMPCALVLWSQDPVMVLRFKSVMEYIHKLGKVWIL